MTAFAIILGSQYWSYEQALCDLNMESLKDRRLSICLSFGQKSQHEKFQHWFQYSEQPSDTKFDPVTCRTRRYKNSPLPYLTKLMNEAT